MELPHIMVQYLRFVNQVDANYIPNAYELQAKFYFWFILRGTVLPILRLIEPSFLKQLLALLRNHICF
jgi:hypothetical protein